MKRGGGSTGFIMKTAAVVIGLYLFTSYFSMSAELADAQAEYDALRATHAVEQQKTAELEDLVEDGMTDRYIISVARSRGYILPGEQIFIDIYGQN
jgi:cell division protein FtsB